jgi:hypothetical protein
MEKISAKDAVRVYADSAEALEKAAGIIESQAQELERYRKREEAQKIASAMREKNLAPTWAPTEQEAVKTIEQLPSQKLAALKMSVDMATPQDPFAHLEQKEDAGTGGHVQGTSALERYVLDDL